MDGEECTARPPLEDDCGTFGSGRYWDDEARSRMQPAN